VNLIESLTGIFYVRVVLKRRRWSTEHQNPKSLLTSVYSQRGTRAQAVIRKKDSKQLLEIRGTRSERWKSKWIDSIERTAFSLPP